MTTSTTENAELDSAHAAWESEEAYRYMFLIELQLVSSTETGQEGHRAAAEATRAHVTPST